MVLYTPDQLISEPLLEQISRVAVGWDSRSRDVFGKSLVITEWKTSDWVSVPKPVTEGFTLLHRFQNDQFGNLQEIVG